MLRLVTSRNFFRLYMYRSSRPCNHFYTAPISRLTHPRHKETISAFLHRYRQSQTPFQSLPFIFKMQEMPNPRGGGDRTKSSLSSRVRRRADSGNHKCQAWKCFSTSPRFRYEKYYSNVMPSHWKALPVKHHFTSIALSRRLCTDINHPKQTSSSYRFSTAPQL